MRQWPAGLLFLAAGALHFAIPQTYERVVPPYLPNPQLLVLVSGLAELAGGLGMLWRPTRKAAGWGLVALLIAVFPANLYMAQAHLMGPAWALWLRLPLQGLLIWWVWWASKTPKG